MTDSQSTPESSPIAALREHAERVVGQRPAGVPLTEAQARHAFHELQVHQVELRMQNEALQRSEANAREAMQSLALLNAQLDEQVQRRTAELLTAREAADAANRAKSVFLATMSHELRTPLGGVLGMIELARRRAGEDAQARLLDKARDSALLLLTLINDVLDLSKIEAGRMVLASQVFTLAEVLAELKDLLAEQAARKGLDLVIEADPGLAQRPVRGDRVRLLQIFINLTGNALKFTDAGSVTVRVLADGGGAGEVRLRVEVQDTGVGIAPKDQPRLFSAFSQLEDSPARHPVGTGLGLVICKHLAMSMRGEIGVLSKRGAGSVFWFTARLGAVDPAEITTARPLVPDAEDALRATHAGKRVLVAEDNTVNQEVIGMLLEHVGLAVDVAPDGEQAVAMARAREYALILMDLQMPVMNGVTATRIVRTIPGRERVPIVALTASAFEEDRERCINAGMDDHIGKPVLPEVLFGTLLKWLH